MSLADRERESLRRAAQYKVKQAIGRGDLATLDGAISCADCGSPADRYDHRSYFKPLEVDPVCCSCNGLRGPAFPLPNEKPFESGNRWSGVCGGEGDGGIPEYHFEGPVEWLVEYDSDPMDDPEFRVAMDELFRLAPVKNKSSFRFRDVWINGEVRGQLLRASIKRQGEWKTTWIAP